MFLVTGRNRSQVAGCQTPTWEVSCSGLPSTLRITASRLSLSLMGRHTFFFSYFNILKSGIYLTVNVFLQHVFFSFRMVHEVHFTTHGSLNLMKFSTDWAQYSFIYPQQPHEVEGSHIPLSLRTERLSLAPSHIADKVRSPDPLSPESRALSHGPPWWSQANSISATRRAPCLLGGGQGTRPSVTFAGLAGAQGFCLVAASTSATWAKGKTLKRQGYGGWR